MAKVNWRLSAVSREMTVGIKSTFETFGTWKLNIPMTGTFTLDNITLKSDPLFGMPTEPPVSSGVDDRVYFRRKWNSFDFR